MKYLVLEVHPGYAVLLDTEGRFVRAANLGYTVGETVTDIVIMRENAGSRFGRTVKLVSGIAAAACVCLVGAGLYLGYYVPNYAEYGTVAMEINPGIRMTLSRTGRVLDLEGINADGEALASGYEFRGKPEKTVADELADRAVAMGYLSDGGEIILDVSAEDTEWRDDTEREAVRTLQEHMEELSLKVQVLTEQQKAEAQEDIQIVITIPPTATPTPAPTPEPTAAVTPPPAAAVPETDDGASDYGSTDDGASDYGSADDGVSDYGGTDDGSSDDGVSDYDDTGDGVSDYGETDDEDDD